ncbi:MAG: tungsten cofactor oxidoreductase radical SAM maturase [Anaerolineae bacterium]|nr:tungsten cofactor oxidoreductase radical SAM maturase [Anaerolineae bacterium]MDW8101969.1 tungsten cofactor oxidoreductase radical SAM maturase [Anaerolineae bacterium]
MLKLFPSPRGGLEIPQELRRRYGLENGTGFLAEVTDIGIVLHPLVPNIRKIYVEITTRCNLNCRTCVRNLWTDPTEDMDPATFERLVTQLKDLPELSEVFFGGYGEPLSHPQFLEFVAALKELKLRVGVSTNGTLLDEAMAEGLVRLGVDSIMVSIDGVNPETFADIRQGAELKAVLDNISRLNAVKEKMRSPLPRIGIEFVALKSNAAELPLLPGLARRLGVARVLVTHLLPHTPEMAAEILYDRNEIPPFPSFPGWPFRSGDWLLWGVMELPRMSWGAERRCRFMASSALVVGWDGSVSPCYALSHSYPYYIFGRRKEVKRYTFGNINQKHLIEIWTSEDYVRFRAEVKRFHFPSCVDCYLRDTCDITASNNGCWGWSPSCADCLWAQDIIRCP